MALRTILTSLFNAAHQHNRRNILEVAQRAGRGAQRAPSELDFLDLGCDDGVWTMEVADAAGARRVHGIEIYAPAAEKARARGIVVRQHDLRDPLPYESNSFDIIHSNQVIEHVPDVDQFAREAFRVLRPGGRFIVSTENGSSWHNIGAAVLGWQIFSLTNMSALRLGVGNPLALHRGSSDFVSSWTHKVIFNYRGLKEFHELHGFHVEAILGAGYYPLPSQVAAWDPRHAHYLTVLARKPGASK